MAFNPYAAGDKVYGGGRPFPTVGPVDKMGYRVRDAENRARRNALLRYLKTDQSQNYMSPTWLRGNSRGLG